MKWHDYYRTWDEYEASFDGLEFSVRLKDSQTGKEAVVKSCIPWAADGGSVFFWGEGNYACDCNRSAEMGMILPCSAGRPRIIITGLVFHGHPHFTEIDPAQDWGVDMNTGRA